MPVTRDGKMWRCQFCYEDWQCHKKNKGGFKTKAEAEEWERNFRQQPQKDLDINFENFVEIYFADMEKPRFEKMVDGHTGFLFADKEGMSLAAMHWEHHFNSMVERYNDIYRVQMSNVTPHVCRHTYCSNMAKSGMNPKTLQYLMGYSDMGVTLNTYMHLGLEDAAEELKGGGRAGRCQKGTGKGQGRESGITENVLGNLIRTKHKKSGYLWRIS